MRPLPGVEATGVFSTVPVALYRDEARIDTTLKRTDGGYWKILDFHFLEGRPFTADEDNSGAHLAVITDELRDKLYDAGPAAGKTFELDGETFRVIGVVPRVSLTRQAAWADAWVPIGTIKSSEYRHSFMGGFRGLVLAHSPADFPRLKRQFLTSLKTTFPLDRKVYTNIYTGLDTPFESTARDFTSNRTDNGSNYLFIGFLAGMAALFITLPVLNLVTLNLSRIMERAPEIGVRKAFGASRPALVWQFVVENVVLTLIGGMAGFIVAVAVLRMVNQAGIVPGAVFDMNLRVFLYGMAIAVFFGVISGVYPAWRMSRLDPVLALRGGAA